ncbi:MAG TPA: EAL domain-containing protein [Candidatus Limnocylindrales bacterium]|nr:EAL domain-containing protein [Candidatus Limnocylindrales bacterium]
MAATGNNGQQSEALGGDEAWIGIEAAASHLALPVRTVYRLAQRGAVPAAKVGRTWRFKRSILDRHLGDADGHRPLLATVTALADLSVELSGLRDPAEIGTMLSSRLATIFRVDLVGLLRREGSDLVTLTASGDLGLPAGFRFDASLDALTDRIAGSTTPVVIEDLPAISDHPIVSRFGLRSAVFVPVPLADGPWGVITMATFTPRRFDPVEVDRLAAIAGQTGLALANTTLLAALERRLASQRQLLHITERLLATRERGAVFEAVADTLAGVVPYDTLTIYLVDRVAGCLVPILARDEYAEEILASRPALGAGITGDVIARGEAEMINDATRDPRVVHVPGTPTDEDESMIVAPIHGSNGIVGAVNIYRAGRHFDDEDLDLVRLFANHVAIALENAGVHDRLLDAARTDPLTGLPNRRFFTERVEQAIARRARRGGRLAVLFLDLDGFKLVNDGLGHAAGDEVLAGVGARLRSAVRGEDVVARLGGDEFGVLLEDVATKDDAITASRRLADALASPLVVDGRTWVIRASVGVALDSGEAPSADELLRDADTAMYRAKAEGGGGMAIFEPSMHFAQLDRLELDSALRDALANRELSLQAQPIVELATGRVAALEMLLRWEHPGRGLVPPTEFIPIAEDSGQIAPIGRWALREACSAFGAWRAAGIAPEGLRLSVNTSVRQLADAAFPAEVERALADAGVSPEQLVLEVTESVMLAEETAAIATLRRLRDAGVHVAVDDFGTGYSSLGYLKRLPVDEIKIDRSFVDGLGREREKTAIVRAAVAFAMALDLAVTAEGIETELQLEHLAALECQYGQGYLFARPLTLDAAAELLRSGRRFAVPTRAREPAA